MEPTTHPAARRGLRSFLLCSSVLAAVALTTAGCGSGASAGANGGSVAGAASHLGNTGDAQAEPAAPRAFDLARGAGSTVQQRAVISTGDVELTSGDVAAVRLRVDGVLARVGGRVADENTTTDDHGTVTRSHLVVRVPSSRFDETMQSLSGLATLRSAARKAQDVTTQVIDLEARIAAERDGVRRLRALVSRAANLRALLAVERELTARQGELESLQQQHAYLSDQTSLATITVDITRHTTPSPAKQSTGGFVGGLRHGWHALVLVIVGALVGIGTAVPFTGVGVLVGIPAWLVVRRLRRPREPEVPAES